MHKSFFKNKTAIVTGSGMGIGKVIAKELCLQGANVVLNGRNSERLERTYQEFVQQKFSVLAVQADVTSYHECIALIQKTLETFGSIDILINNAAVGMRDRFENLQPNVLSAVINTNLLGSVYPSHSSLLFIRQTKGSIVFISSAAGFIGLPNASVYSAGKMALTALAQSLKIELNKSDVHIGIVYVGFTQNDEDKKILSADGKLIPIPTRKHFLVQTQQQVARAVLRMIRKRKFSSTLSFLGKLNAFMARLFPGLTLRIIAASEKRMRLIENEPTSQARSGSS